MKTYTLKDCTFTADVASAAEIRALSDTEINAIMRNAMSAWAYRRAAKADNHGKHFALKAIVADMLATGERGGADGPSKTEEKEIAALFRGHGLTCADDLTRGYKSEAEKDAAVAAFAAKWKLDTTPRWRVTLLDSGDVTVMDDYDAALALEGESDVEFCGLIDPEFHSSANALAVFQAACSAALDSEIARWNTKVGAAGQFKRPDASTIDAVCAFLRFKRWFIKNA